jgi:hypothetical protein
MMRDFSCEKHHISSQSVLITVMLCFWETAMLREFYHTFDGSSWHRSRDMDTARKIAKEAVASCRAASDSTWPDRVRHIAIYMGPWRCKMPEEIGTKIVMVREADRIDAPNGSEFDYVCDYILVPTEGALGKLRQAKKSKFHIFDALGAASFGLLIGFGVSTHFKDKMTEAAFNQCFDSGGVPVIREKYGTRLWTCVSGQNYSPAPQATWQKDIRV